MSSRGRQSRRRAGTAARGADHDHGHGHGGEGGHSHGVSADADRRYLLVALGLLAAFMLGEVIVAIVSGDGPLGVRGRPPGINAGSGPSLPGPDADHPPATCGQSG